MRPRKSVTWTVTWCFIGTFRLATPANGAQQTRRIIRDALNDRYASDVSATWTTVDGVPATQVDVRAKVPALGLFGPTVSVSVSGHAVREVAP